MLNAKSVVAQYSFDFVSNGVSKLVFFIVGIWNEKITEILGAFGNISFSYVGINFVHGSQVFPAADLGGYHFRDFQVVSKGSEAMAEAMKADFRQAVFGADTVDVS